LLPDSAIVVLLWVPCGELSAAGFVDERRRIGRRSRRVWDGCETDKRNERDGKERRSA
jgi:hypothetical protein